MNALHKSSLFNGIRVKNMVGNISLSVYKVFLNLYESNKDQKGKDFDTVFLVVKGVYRVYLLLYFLKLTC